MIVDFNSNIWLEPWFQRLSRTAKVLYIYLYGNDHKNLIGLYYLSIQFMAVETGIPAKEIEVALKVLSPKIQYDHEKSVVWVVEHFKEQFLRNGKLSPKILRRAIQNILSMKPHPFTDKFQEHYPIVEHQYEKLEEPF